MHLFQLCVRAIKIKIHLNWSVKALEIFSLNFCQRLKSINAQIFFNAFTIRSKFSGNGIVQLMSFSGATELNGYITKNNVNAYITPALPVSTVSR